MREDFVWKARLSSSQQQVLAPAPELSHEAKLDHGTIQSVLNRHLPAGFRQNVASNETVNVSPKRGLGHARPTSFSRQSSEPSKNVLFRELRLREVAEHPVPRRRS